jgi:hypothetical protein
MRDCKNYISADSKGYEHQWTEKDAYKWARRVMNLYKNKINKLLGIDNDWRIKNTIPVEIDIINNSKGDAH